MLRFLSSVAVCAFFFGLAAGVKHLAAPPEPANYRVVYLGMKSCGACKYWKSNTLPEWRKNPNSKYVKLEMAEIQPRGDFGSYQKVADEVFAGRIGMLFPTYGVYSNGELTRVYVGASGWKQIEQLASKEAKYDQKRQQKVTG